MKCFKLEKMETNNVSGTVDRGIVPNVEDKDNPNKYDSFKIRQVIRIRYQTICECYKSENNKTLFSENIITPKKFQHLKQQLKEYGEIQQCEVLLDYILEEASNDQVMGFLDILKRKQYDVYKIIEGGLQGKTIHTFLQDIKEQLKNAYAKKKYHYIEALPGEEFILDFQTKGFIMPLVFETKVRKRNNQSDFMKRNKYYYDSENYGSIEEILGSLLMNNSASGEGDAAKVVLITGEAGCGKTVCVNKITCQWMDGSDTHLNQYDIVITIPLRDVDTDESLTTILSDAKPKSDNHKGGLNYINDANILKALDDYLREEMKQSDKRVLFILDGADEVELIEKSDLFKLITGNCFHNINVLLTIRPEAKLFQKLVDFSPNFKVIIHGTNEEGVYQYLKEMMTTEGGPSDEEITALIEKCQRKMGTFELLKVPLYLTLIGVMFIEHWARNANFTNFEVPTTTTKLFNSFFHILLHRWMKRDSCYSKIEQVRFGRHPYDQSNIPNKILMKLHIFANLSYIFLKRKQYDFTTQDLSKYHIDINDVIESGFFCHSSSTYFYKHKMLQEFMAALYLIHPLCLETFKTPTEQDTLDTILFQSDIFLGLLNIPIFVFGMSPQHAMDVIGNLQGKVKLNIGKRWFDRLNGINVRLALDLCRESEDINVTNAMIPPLSQSQICFTDDCGSFTSISQCKAFFSFLTTKQVVSLLLSWYNIHIYPIEEGWGIVNGHNSNTEISDIIYNSVIRSLRIKMLDIKLMLLLQRFTLPQVYALFIDGTFDNVPDLITTGKMFPNITKLFVAYTREESYDTTLNIDETSSSKITALQHISHWDLMYSPQSQQLLLQQSQLETLCINGALIHDIHNSQQQQPYWPKLHALKLYIKKLVSDKQTGGSDHGDTYVCDVIDLCHLLKGAPQLNVLSLYRYDNAFPSVNTIITLLHCIKEHLTHLNKLHFCRMINSQTLPKLFPVIGNMKQLTNLGMDYQDIDRNMKLLVDILYKVNSIKRLEILYFNTDESEAQTTMNVIRQFMNSHYPDMSIEVSCTERHATYLQSELPDILPFNEFV